MLALLLSFGFLFLAPSARKSLLLRSIVRTRFEFVVLTLKTVEVKDFLGVWSHDQPHGLLPTRISILTLPLRLYEGTGPAVCKPAFFNAVTKPMAVLGCARKYLDIFRQ